MTWKKIATHEPDHQGCDPAECGLVADMHEMESIHSLCGPKYCDVAKNVDDAHRTGTHDFDCTPDLCSEVAKSHEADHKLCNIAFCDVAFNTHFNTNHKGCNTYWCDAYSDILKYHNLGKHSMWCDLKSCQTIKSLHNKNNHQLCKQIFCHDLKQSHQTDHKICNDPQCNVELRKQITDAAHAEGRHDENLCNQHTCDFIKQKHQKGLHGYCSNSLCVTMPLWLYMMPNEAE